MQLGIKNNRCSVLTSNYILILSESMAILKSNGITNKEKFALIENETHIKEPLIQETAGHIPIIYNCIIRIVQVGLLISKCFW